MLPKWDRIKLGEIASFRNGINYSKKNFGKGIKVIGVKDFKDLFIAPLADLDEINPEGVIRQEDLLQHNDILFVRSNGNRNLIGRTLLVQYPKEEVTYSGFTIRLRFISNRVLPRYYSYLFKTPVIRKVLIAYGGGTNINNLNQRILNDLNVPLPSLPIQHKISSILSAYDDLIENNKRRIQILEEMAERLYREWFVHFRFPGNEDVEIVESEFGLIPKNWEVRDIFEVANINYGKTLPRKNLSENSPYLVYGAAKVIGRYDEYNIEKPTVITGCRGSCGQMKITKPNSFVTNNSFIFEFNDEHKLFFYHQLINRGLDDCIGGTAQPQITKESISIVKLFVPTNNIMTKFHEVSSSIYQLINLLDDKNSILSQTRDLLLPKLISGKIDVSNLDIDIGADAA